MSESDRTAHPRLKSWQRHRHCAQSRQRVGAGRCKTRGLVGAFHGRECDGFSTADVVQAIAEAGLSTPKVEEAMTGSRIGIRSLGDTPIYPPLPEPARIGTPEPDTKENTMPQPILVEDKTWEETSPDNRLNGNSYAAIGAFGLTTMAVEELHRHGQPITRATVRALSSTFAAIVREVQTEMSGQSSMQHGTNSRITRESPAR